MKKIIVTFVLTAVLAVSGCVLAAGYQIGNYLVEFGLMRGSSDDPIAPTNRKTLVHMNQGFLFFQNV